MADSECLWQCEEARCTVVLREVFAWLDAHELARAGAACRAWRRAAAEPSLWRRLLLRQTSVPRLPSVSISWRQEYVSACAGWEEAARLSAGAALLHAALAPTGDRFALAADDASIAVWQYASNGAWEPRWSAGLRARGWLSAARVLWAADGARLLVTGLLALVDSWELLVLHVDGVSRLRLVRFELENHSHTDLPRHLTYTEYGHGRAESRARCSAGAAGCWAGTRGDAFLSFELRVLAPSIACTTVWLNAATQEMQSEYAGVTTPLLRIYNEDGAHITHASVVEVPVEATSPSTVPASDPWASEADDDAEYHRVTQSKRAEASAMVLVTSCGADGGTSMLCAWGLSALRPPPLLASSGGDLPERVRRRRERLALALDEPVEIEPDEASVRAICTSPDYVCHLPALPIGMVPHLSGRCMWVSTCDGSAWCMSLPALRRLRVVRAPAAAPDPAHLHYAQPALSDAYFASPLGARSGRVCTWAATSGVRCPAAREPTHAAPALAALLPPTDPPTMLVIAGDAVHVWRSRATPQCSLLALLSDR